MRSEDGLAINQDKEIGLIWKDRGNSVERLTERNKNRCDLCAANYDGVCLLPNTFPCDDYKRYHRLAVIEDILGDDYNLDKLRVMMNQE